MEGPVEASVAVRGPGHLVPALPDHLAGVVQAGDHPLLEEDHVLGVHAEVVVLLEVGNG